MIFQHKRGYLSPGDVVLVHCSHQCNIKLMDDSNFSRYKRGDSHNYYGGHYERFPARLGIPHSGYWNATLDLAGGAATIKFSIEFLKAT